jgi:tetratricopeptide (TPR) repeat protein
MGQTIGFVCPSTRNIYMTKRLAVSLYLAVAVTTALRAQPAAPAPLTPAEIAIHKAQGDIAQRRDHFPYYNNLAMAYARRARETSDSAYYVRAEETLKKSFAIQPDNFEGLKIETYLLLTRHEFAQALEIAKKLNKQTPDDVAVYGYIADADAELGNYKDAVDAAQWMLRIRPGNTPALIRAGFLREIYGDLDGAMEVLRMAFDATPYQESEDRAWLLTQMAHVKLISNDLKTAETFANNALSLFPNYSAAVESLGQVRMAQQRYTEAAALFQKLYAASPRPEHLFAAAQALNKAGKKDDAAKTFSEFESLAVKASGSADNANRELIEYYADYAKEPVKALQLAQQEAAKRHDIYTLDSYAWSLAANGDYAHAQVEMQRALATGVKDPHILEHANARPFRLLPRQVHAQAPVDK